jgi:hypothetical protein
VLSVYSLLIEIGEAGLEQLNFQCEDLEQLDQIQDKDLPQG